uniref:Gustatory receptor n=1 Tax=Tetranychus urticae TaxID=32264 RepID=T1KQ62_TETUR
MNNFLPFVDIFHWYNKLKMKLFSKSRHYSLSPFKITIINLLFGLPNHSLTSEETIKQLVKFEKFSIFFRASRFGFNQNVSHQSAKTDYFRLIIRAIDQITLIRCICLTLIDNEDYQLYLGDFAYKTKYRSMINILMSISFSLGAVNSELIVLYDKSGKYSVLTIYSDIIKNGFDPVHLQMTSNQAINFHRSIHILVTQLNRSFIFICFFVEPCYYTILLFNPHFYQVKPLPYFSLAWSLVVIFVAVALFGRYFAIFGYIFLIQAYSMHKLRSVVELSDSYRRLKCTDELASTFIKYTFECLNQWEKSAHLTGALVFSAFAVIVPIGDLLIFYGFIVRFHSPLFANSVGSLGCIAFTVIGYLSLIGREFIIKIERSYSNLQIMCRYNALDVHNQFKLLQLMERLSDPNIGIQLGSIITIRKDFFIKFMLEIGSSLMLFTMNFKRYF